MSDLTSPVVVKAASQNLVFNFVGEANMTGKPSGIWLGTAQADGGGHAGLLSIRNDAGFEAMTIDGNSGFVARDHTGKLVFNFAGEANMTGSPSGLWLGTGQEEGGGH